MGFRFAARVSLFPAPPSAAKLDEILENLSEWHENERGSTLVGKLTDIESKVGMLEKNRQLE